MFSQKREITYNLHFNNSEKSSLITIKEENKMLFLQYKLIDSISSDLNTTYYTPEKNFNTCYKGYGLYGVGAPRADYLGTVKVAAQLSIA